MSKIAKWGRVSTMASGDDVLIYAGKEYRITLQKIAEALQTILVGLGFLQSSTVISKRKIKKIDSATQTSYTVQTSDDVILVNCASASVAISMPAAASIYDSVNALSQVITIQRIDNSASFSCAITPNGAEQINLAASKTLTGTTFPGVDIASDGSNLFTISET